MTKPIFDECVETLYNTLVEELQKASLIPSTDYKEPKKETLLKYIEMINHIVVLYESLKFDVDGLDETVLTIFELMAENIMLKDKLNSTRG
jgi:hypothetical protein